MPAKIKKQTKKVQKIGAATVAQFKIKRRSKSRATKSTKNLAAKISPATDNHNQPLASKATAAEKVDSLDLLLPLSAIEQAISQPQIKPRASQSLAADYQTGRPPAWGVDFIGQKSALAQLSLVSLFRLLARSKQ